MSDLNINDTPHGWARRLLLGRIFLGEYKERRYVDSLREYRDVVILNSGETQLMEDLDNVRDKFRKSPQLIAWIGITYPDFPGVPEGYCIWVQLSNIPFGHYWFRIKNVISTPNEISFHLKVVRYLNTNEADQFTGKAILAAKPIKSEQPSDTQPSDPTQSQETKPIPIPDIELILDNLKQMFQNFTPGNIIFAIKMLVTLIITLTYFSIQLIGSLGEFSLKFLKEFSNLVRISTPIILSIIDFFSKCIGGFYLLLAMMWRDAVHRPDPRPPTNLPQLMGSSPSAGYTRQNSRNSVFRRKSNPPPRGDSNPYPF